MSVIGRAARLAWRAFMRYQDHNGPDRAAAVAYYTLMSLLPMLIFLISIGVAAVGSFEGAYRGSLFLISGVVVHLDQTDAGRLAHVRRALAGASASRPCSSWPGRRGASSPRSSRRSSAIFGVPGRSFAKGNLVALGMVLIAGVGLLITMVATMTIATAEGLVTRFIGPETGGALHEFVGHVVTLVVPIVITFSFFFLIYRVVPRRVVSTAPYVRCP